MTVSRVINDDSSVTAETRALVQSAIQALNYSPNPAARRLAGSESLRLGLLYSNPSAAYLAEFLIGALDEAAKTGHQLVVERCTDPAAACAAVRKLVQGGAAALILPPPLCESEEVLAAVRQGGIVAVAVASGCPASDLPAVGMDNYAAAGDMTRHLLALGHRRIGFIKGHPNQSVSAQRFQGFLDALAGAGLPAAEAPVGQGFFDYRSGLQAAERLLAGPDRPTAIFAANDDMAAATISEALRLGLDVPGALSVVGFDDTLIAAAIWPSLTTIRQPIADMGAAAVELALEEIRRRRSGDDRPPCRRQLGYTLVARDSSGPAPSAAQST